MSNKDEALRAKCLAEDWMRKSNFSTARRVAIKAQKMDETLENIAHMIMVCDVHCAASDKFGNETDWYKILQIEHNADDSTIKKQYRKLALHLHPDKNKLPGAEAAFKTIGEAQRVLLDKDKRRLHDMKRKPFKRPAPVPSYQPQQAPTTAFYTPPFQNNVDAARNSFAAGLRPENQQNPQAQPAGFSENRTIWTSCAFCHINHECLREYLHKQLICPSCGKQFVAFQIAFQGPPVQPTFSFYQQSKVPTQEAGETMHKQPETSARIPPSKEGPRAKSSGSSAENINGERKRKTIVESTDSSSSESSYELEEDATGGQHSRRSVRSKQNVSYNENVCEDGKKKKDAESAEESYFRKKSHENNMFAKTLPNVRNRKEKVKNDQVESSGRSGACHATKDSSSMSESDLEIFECADPDFTNFEKLREECCFQAGQIWAMYDMGRMPRYYANIRKVIREPKFMLKITWLEAKPDDERAKWWVRKKMPVSVGKYQHGGDENTSETPWFSHPIRCRVRGMKDIVCVYPRIGETWALFKNWDVSWSSGRGSHEYKYEFVEILSEYVEGFPITVAFLRKVKGFVSVFCRVGPGGRSNTFQILPHELLRFSHSIPSTKLTGEERNGVPVGSYEFDTAALPQMIEEGEEEDVHVLRKAAKSNQVRHRSPPSSEPDCMVIPNFEFHDFSAERLEGKFTAGQIWSLNCKEEGLPKYYAKIQKVEWRPVFKLQINMLELESHAENVTQWRDKRMPVSCGKFTLKEGRCKALTHVTGFSHHIKVQESKRKNEYTILPKTGDIWAMYKNWSDAIKVASLKKCDYEVVEVLDDEESHIEVMMLERVDRFISVFKEKVEGGIDVRRTIPRCELLRFSHYVPAFRLTEERYGTLRGFVELDSTALPRNLRGS